MGFIEALRWSQLFPAEICALVGLDPATPECYKDFDIDKAVEGLIFMAKEKEIREEYIEAALSQLKDEFHFLDEELNEYKEILNRKLANRVWISEAENLRNSISLVESGKTVQVPILFLVSNGEGTTQEREVWRNHAINYLRAIKAAEYELFDYPHNLYKFAPQKMADAVHEFFLKHIG